MTHIEMKRPRSDARSHGTDMRSPRVTREPTAARRIERRRDDVSCAVADRTYRVRGLAKTRSPDAVCVNLAAKHGEGETAGVHVDTLDLYTAQARGLFILQAAKELSVSEETIKRRRSER
jgi:DNA primase